MLSLLRYLMDILYSMNGFYYFFCSSPVFTQESKLNIDGYVHRYVFVCV